MATEYGYFCLSDVQQKIKSICDSLNNLPDQTTGDKPRQYNTLKQDVSRGLEKICECKHVFDSLRINEIYKCKEWIDYYAHNEIWFSDFELLFEKIYVIFFHVNDCIPIRDPLCRGIQDLFKHFKTNTISDLGDELQEKLSDDNVKIIRNVYLSQVLSDQAFALKTINDFSDSLVNSQKKYENENNKFEERSLHIKKLNDKLQKIDSGYNFVGIAQAFSKLKEEKCREKKWSFGWMVLFGSLMLALPCVEIGLVYCKVISPFLTGIENKETQKILTLSNYLPWIIPSLVILQILFIYFFRIILLRHRSTKAQILQLSLRHNLCAFIQSYAEFAKDIKQNDPAALAQFEQLIFSNIVASEDQIPAVFEGAQELANLRQSSANKDKKDD